MAPMAVVRMLGAGVAQLVNAQLLPIAMLQLLRCPKASLQSLSVIRAPWALRMILLAWVTDQNWARKQHDPLEFQR